MVDQSSRRDGHSRCWPPPGGIPGTHRALREGEREGQRWEDGDGDLPHSSDLHRERESHITDIHMPNVCIYSAHHTTISEYTVLRILLMRIQGAVNILNYVCR